MRLTNANDKPTTLYYIYFPQLNLWKIGCTYKSVSERFKQEPLEYQVLFTKEYNTGYEAYEVERWLLEYTKADRPEGKVLKAKGNSELRTKPVANLELIIITMAESSHRLT